MLEYRRVGELIGAESRNDLWLPIGRPLSYLRVGDRSGSRQALVRALLELRATEFRRRIPLAFESAGDRAREEVGPSLMHFDVSGVYPVLHGRCTAEGREVDICWLDRIQTEAVCRGMETGFERGNAPVTVNGLDISPTFVPTPAASASPIADDWQYWNSRWEYSTSAPERGEWWRVRPNLIRNRPRSGLLPGPGAQARGTFAASLHRMMWEQLGNPRYVVAEHPFRGARLPVLVLPDKGLEACDESVWRRTVFLDRSAREALGIGDGEFCLVHSWHRPRRAVWARAMRDRYVGARAVCANVSTSARADLEKPVCRLEPEALAAIGGRAGEFVTLEGLACQDPKREGGKGERWRRRRISRRVLPIDAAERSRRAGLEAFQSWDDASHSPTDCGGESPELKREGFVDCAETLGVYPPFPTVYLNFYTRRNLGVGLCDPIEIRVSFLSRLAAEAGNLSWLVLIGLIGTVAALLHMPIGAIVVVLAVTLLILLFLRAARAIR